MTVAQRITVTISDSLHGRLQRVKDSLNVSRVCQEAIEYAVQIEETKLKEIPVVEKVLERLRLEKERSEAEWKQIGVKDGQEDAAELSYNEFRLLELDDELSEETHEWIESKRIQYLENPDEDVYLEGWKEGVLSVWDQVKGRL
ncbi:hypothetical protein H6F86_00450 [Phormidium sp. FACHB-592]|uniref:CopG family transcriptional regulator n=1 Tax=Stenomitos frigidus AS-A4 TaxID=2933935 RepID=A0ABV0KSX5_9CYAN|nr:hypothetical protein [Phormidium sp. FACHB-592]MBD2072404.1 hypothetical protein [Phormidium sp. FACHB-592]